MESASSSPHQYPSGCCRERTYSRDRTIADSTSAGSASRRPNLGAENLVAANCVFPCSKLMQFITPQGSVRKPLIRIRLFTPAFPQGLKPRLILLDLRHGTQRVPGRALSKPGLCNQSYSLFPSPCFFTAP